MSDTQQTIEGAIADKLQLFCESSDLEFAAGKGTDKKARFSMVAYTGGEILQFGERLVLDLDGMSLPSTGVPIRLNHDADQGVGHTTSIKIETGRLLLVGIVSRDTEAAREVVAAAKSGFPWQASVGCTMGDVEHIQAGSKVTVNRRTFAGPLYVVRDSRLEEVSFVDRGADGETAASIAASAARKEVDMSVNDKLKAGVDVLAQDRDRVAKVIQLTADHPDIQAKAIAEGWNPEQCELRVLRADSDRSKLEALRSDRPNTNVHMGTVNESAPTDILTAAILDHAGMPETAKKHFGEAALGQAKQMKCRTLLDICAASLSMAGRSVPMDRSQLIQAAVSALEMPIALGDAAGKIALDAYRESAGTWRTFCRIRPVRDFKEVKLIRGIVGGGYKQVPHGGEVSHGTLSEETSALSADTYGMLLGLDRRDIINDDLGMFSDIAREIGKAGARAVADSVYTALMANLESDGSDFYHSDNSNLVTGGGTALDFASLQTALESMVAYTDSEGRSIDMRPKLLVVPPELEVTGRMLVSSETVGRNTSSTDLLPEGNPFQELTLVVEPRLSNSTYTGYSTTAWHLFTAPVDAAVTVAFLDGRDSPVVESFDQPSNVLGMVFRGYHDFGVVLSDPRASYKADGA